MIRPALWRITVALACAAVLGATAAVRAQERHHRDARRRGAGRELGVLPDASVVAVHAPPGPGTRHSPRSTSGSTC